MKKIKTRITYLFMLILAVACTDNLRDLSFVENVAAPANVSASFTILQDNTGTVSIAPSAEGAVNFDIYFGDATVDPVNINQGSTVEHIYGENTFTVKVVAFNMNGDATEVSEELVVSFQAPQNLVVTLENDVAISKQVNIKATADFAAMYEFYSGEDGVTQPVISGNIGNSVSYQYAEPGTYAVKVVAKGGAIETTEYTVDFEVTAILAPIESAAKPPSRNDADVVSVFSGEYTDIADSDFYPNWGQSTQFTAFDLNGDAMLQYSGLNYQGINLGAAIDASSLETLHIDIWTSDATSIDIFPLPNGVQPADEKFVTKTLIADQWNSFDIPMSEFTDQGLSVDDLMQFKFVGSGTVFIDNLYFWKAPSAPSILAGTWKLAPEAGSLKVGPSAGSGDWWSINAAQVVERACYFNDEYVFGDFGSFQNILGSETWVEAWQGLSADACASPLAPYDGSNGATFIHDGANNKLTINGLGSYLGLPKANNAGELPNVSVPSLITYDITLSNNNTEMEVIIEAGSGVFWTYKLVKDALIVSPIDGTWKVAPEAGSLKVGPTSGSGDWWSISDAQVAERACFFDDEYVFSAGGSFNNILGTETWLEKWQGAPADACGVPIAPHDGSISASFVYDDTSNTITLNGTGSYLGIPKANNAGELLNIVDTPDSIVYNVTLSNNNTAMEIIIEAGSGVFWTYKLLKQ